ncbi:MAG: DEAD/DEAH box helicase [Paenibacillaceae bacterium]|nr:DEAD/DEAH box helicase [Paenibacillaceae bacterium]
MTDGFDTGKGKDERSADRGDERGGEAGASGFDTLLPVAAPWAERLRELGIAEPTPVQAEAIPQLIAGRDALVQSQTGTGKTLAYLLPVLQGIDAASKRTQAVVLVPTRELGMQIVRVAEALTAGSGIGVQPLIGGAALQRQIEKLRLHPQLVVGTPGRVLELIKKKKLSMHEVRTIVVDEVDQVFELGSMQDAEAVMASARRDRQLAFVSATMPDALQSVADRWLRTPAVIRPGTERRVADTLTHLFFVSDRRDKIDTLRKLIRLYDPVSAIIFVSDTEDVGEAAAKLVYGGLDVEALYGEAGKQDRTNVMNRFRGGRGKLLLATDIAARGLDLPEVTHVFNFDTPHEADRYVHRAGRTGRMGRSGTVVSIVEERERYVIERLAKQLGVTFAEKAMYAGKVVAPEENRSAAAKRARAEARERSEAGGGSGSGSGAGARERSEAGGGGSGSGAGARERSEAGGGSGSGAGARARGEAGGAAAQRKSERERDRKNKGAPRWLKQKQQQAAEESKRP